MVKNGNWQIYPRSPSRSTPLASKHRCLEYCYTKLSRSTPWQLSIDALNTVTLNLADLPQICWQIYPLPIKHRCLEYHYTKLDRSTSQSSINHIHLVLRNMLIPFHHFQHFTYRHSLSLSLSLMYAVDIDLWQTITPTMFHI